MTGDLRDKSGLGTGSSRAKGGFTVVELIVVLLVIVVLVALFFPAVRTARPAARRSMCKNNLKQIAIALHNYAEEFHALPPAYTVDAAGRRLHSWRTLILPYLDEKSLYAKIDLSKPWDDPANAEAFQASVDVYHCPEAVCPPNHTTYLAVVADSSCLLPMKPRPLTEIADPANTLLMIEVESDHAVHWMSPVDADEALILALSPDAKLPHASGMNAALVDGSVRFLGGSLSSAERRALISVNASDKQPLASNSAE